MQYRGGVCLASTQEFKKRKPQWRAQWKGPYCICTLSIRPATNEDEKQNPTQRKPRSYYTKPYSHERCIINNSNEEVGKVSRRVAMEIWADSGHSIGDNFCCKWSADTTLFQILQSPSAGVPFQGLPSLGAAPQNQFSSFIMHYKLCESCPPACLIVGAKSHWARYPPFLFATACNVWVSNKRST